MFRRTCITRVLSAFYLAHGAAGAIVASGFPCALCLFEGPSDANLAQIMPRECGVTPPAVMLPVYAEASTRLAILGAPKL
jgi:hypothetical protein